MWLNDSCGNKNQYIPPRDPRPRPRPLNSRQQSQASSSESSSSRQPVDLRSTSRAAQGHQPPLHRSRDVHENNAGRLSYGPGARSVEIGESSRSCLDRILSGESQVMAVRDAVGSNESGGLGQNRQGERSDVQDQSEDMELDSDPLNIEIEHYPSSHTSKPTYPSRASLFDQADGPPFDHDQEQSLDQSQDMEMGSSPLNIQIELGSSHPDFISNPSVSAKPSESRDSEQTSTHPSRAPQSGSSRSAATGEGIAAAAGVSGNIQLQSIDQQVQPQAISTTSSTGISGLTADSSRLTISDPSSSSANGSNQTPNYRSGLIYSSEMMKHYNSNDQEHPEAPERIFRIFAALKKHGFVERMKRIKIREAIKQEVGLIHLSSVWDGAEATAFFTRRQLDDQYEAIDRYRSLYLNEHSAQCARLSCGGVIELCDAVASRKVQNGFAIVRPPGHHAEPDVSMGFCFYNNVAVAASWLLKKYQRNHLYDNQHAENRNKIERILIIDWDVHHGNGTQKAFYNDPNVLYVSIHRYENGTFYPGGTLGSAQMVGDAGAKGFNVNIPWSRNGMGDGEYLKVFYKLILPIALQFNPDFVLISAGFDAARGDQLGECDVTPEGFGQLTSLLCPLAEGRCVAALEGGYNIESIASSALEVTRVLLGDPPKPLQAELTVSALANDTIRQVKRIQSKYWSCLGSSPSDPDEVDFEDDNETISQDEEERTGMRNQLRGINGHKKVKNQVIDLSQLIKAYRKEMLWKEYSLVELNGPNEGFASEDEAEVQYHPWPDKNSRIGSAFGSENLLEDELNNTLVFFVHDLGNLRHERFLQSVKAEDELAYVLDSSGILLDWVIKDKNYGVLDVNLNSQLQLTPNRSMQEQTSLGSDKILNPISKSFESKNESKSAFSSRTYSDYEKELVFMLWDSYVELSSSKNIVMIGHGNGCDLLMSILNERNADHKVKAVVMALGHGALPMIEKGRPELKAWYGQNSLVLIPRLHPLFTADRQRSAGSRLGKVVRSDEIQPTRLLARSLPDIISFIEAKLDAVSPASNGI